MSESDTPMVGFLHGHPKLESFWGLDGEHVIVDKKDCIKARQLERERAMLLAVVQQIAAYEKDSKFGDGICPYGCDAPNIAKAALRACQPTQDKAQ